MLVHDIIKHAMSYTREPISVLAQPREASHHCHVNCADANSGLRITCRSLCLCLAGVGVCQCLAASHSGKRHCRTCLQGASPLLPAQIAPPAIDAQMGYLIPWQSVWTRC